MQLHELTQEGIIRLVKPIWDNIIVTSNKRCYQTFSKDFSTEMLQHATRKDIEDQWESLPVLRSLQSNPEFMGYLKNKDRIRVLWKQKSSATTDELLGHLELIIENEQVKVDGAQIV